ncbi:MAG: hypothetical protein AABX34_06645 [Nanoarchaeota archaeon]
MDKRTERTALKIALGFLMVLILGIGNLLVMAVINDGNDGVKGEEDETEDEREDVAITGNELKQASAAALSYIGDGRVTDTEIGDEEGYYEVEVTLNNGQEVDVHLDKDFKVLSWESDSDEEEDD